MNGTVLTGMSVLVWSLAGKRREDDAAEVDRASRDLGKNRQRQKYVVAFFLHIVPHFYLK